LPFIPTSFSFAALVAAIVVAAAVVADMIPSSSPAETYKILVRRLPLGVNPGVTPSDRGGAATDQSKELRVRIDADCGPGRASRVVVVVASLFPDAAVPIDVADA
jgi:hypothetical protein